VTFGLLRDPLFRRLFVAQGVSFVGDRMVGIALAFAVLDLTGSPADVGLVLAARNAPLVVLILLGGVAGDRLSRRRIMVVADLVRVVTQGASAALLITGGAEVWSLAVLAAAGGSATAFFAPASIGILPAVVAPERLAEANGLRSIALSGGEVAGPLLAGLLIELASPGWALGVDAATYAVSAVALAGLRVADHVPAAAQSLLADLRDGWRDFRSRRWLWTFVAMAGASNCLFAALQVLGPVVAARDLGGAGAWALCLSGMGVGTVAGALLALRADPARPVLVATLAFGLMPVPLALLALAAPVAVVAAGTLLAGLGMMLGNAVWETAMQRHVPGPALSRVSSYDWLGSLALQPIGLALWGPVAAGVGIADALWIAFGLMVLSTAALLLVPEVRRLPRLPTSAA
jgi:predicted MFS family arabinose efflux permease